MREVLAAIYAAAIKFISLFVRSVDVTERVLNTLEDIVKIGEDEANISYKESALRNRKRMADLAKELGIDEQELKDAA